jgi:hypothetical protein
MSSLSTSPTYQYGSISSIGGATNPGTISGFGQTGSNSNLQGYPVNLQNAYYSPYGGSSQGQIAGGGQTAARQVSDPYAKWGGTTAYNNKLQGFNNQKGGIFSSAMDAARASGGKINESILSLIDQLRSGQSSIDNDAVNNELAKLQGFSGVQGMVGRGINAGQTMIGNMNAGDSSAAEGIARAYGEIGNREMRNVNNQYEMGNREVDIAQQNLEQQKIGQMRGITNSKEDHINNIVMSASEKLAALDADMLQADMPTRIALDQEKQAVKAQVMAELQKYDSMLQEQVAGVKGTTADQRRAEAAKLQSKGFDLGDQAFDFTSQVPGQLQGTGPFTSGLPIFTNRFRQED